MLFVIPPPTFRIFYKVSIPVTSTPSKFPGVTSLSLGVLAAPKLGTGLCIASDSLTSRFVEFVEVP